MGRRAGMKAGARVGSQSDFKEGKYPVCGCSRCLLFLAVPVRADCAELGSLFTELFFSFHGRWENIASLMEIENTVL